MSKYLCNFANRIVGEQALTCSLTRTACKYMSYCNQDHKYWCAKNYGDCERRKTEMAKNKNFEKNKNTQNIKDIEKKNIVKENQIEETVEKVETSNKKADVSVETVAPKEVKPVVSAKTPVSYKKRNKILQ